ncbi:unnamed protein product [Enterobius vermicularis]|uniref:HD_domain domain-containing protein n=1 Tax=Enterobius vermicularis TaxID=51028 RepID=A0A0N4UVN2_ENTVE|nr:unnamed protein product [Enterobius vermicularis]
MKESMTTEKKNQIAPAQRELLTLGFLMAFSKSSISTKKIWPPTPTARGLREVSDIIYGFIPLYYPVNLIVDTPEFQRLRRIKQMGTVDLIQNFKLLMDESVPLGSVNVFICTISFPVYYLSTQFVNLLAEKPNTGIDSRDRLCVAIAGLCHDIGHGPFSHLYEECLKRVDQGNSWTHEKASVLIFRRLCKNKELKKALDEFLEPEDYVFIEEIIKPPKEKFDKSGCWAYQGRPREKSFLYDIVCNVNDSFDVDKYDYLLRDSLYTGLAIPFNKNTLKRIMSWAMPLEVSDETDKNKNKYFRLCYAEKVSKDLWHVGESRYLLHQTVLDHRVTRVCEHLLLKIITAAAEHLTFTGDDGRQYNLATITKNLEAFLKSDDSILDTSTFVKIRKSTTQEFKEAKYYCECLSRRCLPKFVGKKSLITSEDAEKWNSEEKVKKAILQKVDSDSISEKDIIVSIRSLHYGMGIEENPMNRVLLYNPKATKIAAFAYDGEEVTPIKKVKRRLDGDVSVTVFLSYEAFKRDESIVEVVRKAFKLCFFLMHQLENELVIWSSIKFCIKISPVNAQYYYRLTVCHKDNQTTDQLISKLSIAVLKKCNFSEISLNLRYYYV